MSAKRFFWLNPNLIQKKTERLGYATFTKKKIYKGELLLIVGGFIMKLSDEEKLHPSFCDNGLQISDDHSIASRKREELGGINYVNHSCNPNAGIKGQIFLVAMRDIKSGEEITFDYAMTLFDSKKAKPYRLVCTCGETNCRKIITGNDWKKKNIQKKYRGYFQVFLQEKINHSQ